MVTRLQHDMEGLESPTFGAKSDDDAHRAQVSADPVNHTRDDAPRVKQTCEKARSAAMARCAPRQPDSSTWTEKCHATDGGFTGHEVKCSRPRQARSAPPPPSTAPPTASAKMSSHQVQQELLTTPNTNSKTPVGALLLAAPFFACCTGGALVLMTA